MAGAWALATAAWGQATVEVTDEADALPARGVTVYLMLGGQRLDSLVTDAQGRGQFRATGLAPTGAYALEVRHPLYQLVGFSRVPGEAWRYRVRVKPRSTLVDEVVVSANRQLENKVRVPQVIQVVGEEQIARTNPTTSADLVEKAGVFVQRSQIGGGSPVLRGFEASRILLVVDGVRMNNAIYRTGHLQSSITLDPAMLERVEVLYGPGSTVFGSDALGGVLHYVTRRPQTSTTDSLRVFGGGFLRAATATEELAASVWLNLGGRRLASLTSVSYKQVGDVRLGRQRSSSWAAPFGQQTFRVERRGGVDTVVPDDPNVLEGFGYQQADVLQKFSLVADNVAWGLNLQASSSSDIPRYDALVETTATGTPVSAHWVYGPQHRLLGALSAQLLRPSALYDLARITASWQWVQEARINRNFGSASERTQQERVHVAALNADLTRELGAHTLRYGLELAQNWVASDAWRRDVDTGLRTERPDQTRYPAGGATQASAAAYVSHRWEVAPGLWLSDGLRYTYTAVNLRFRDGAFTPLPGFPETSATRIGALTGLVGGVWTPRPAWRFALQASTGFRTPNVNDLGKFFDSRPGDVGDGLVVANPDLGPERTYNLEATAQFSLPGTLLISATGFYTWIDGLIGLGLGTYLGQPTVTVEGTDYTVYRYANLTQARIAGAQAELRYLPAPGWELGTQVVYTHGRVTRPARGPLDHIPPAYGSLFVRFNPGKLLLEASATAHAWKWLSDYRLGAEDNEASATPLGTPNWLRLDARAQYALHPRLTLQVALENVLDSHYRSFASDVSAPGRNLVLALRTQF
ncbi:MAG: TonB-dependent receptor [Bacteroidia bacterium]|nr:TonB-dependent receptor [Bacteroidia bacterium]